MSWRLKKQLIYGLIFIFIFSFLIIGLFILIKPPPSCFDGKQNGNEEGIDCGGPCLPCEIVNLNLTSEKPKIIYYPDNTIDIIIKLKNPSSKYGLKKFKAKIILIGEDVKAEFSEENFILPLQTKFLTFLNFKKPDFEIKSVNLEIDFDKKDWQEIEYQETQIEMLNYSYEENKFKAEIVNNDNFPYSEVEINFIIYDIFENIIGALKTKIDYLEPLERKEIILTLPPLVNQINRIEMKAYYNFFKENEN
ncbi:MAG: hypothetical protein NZ866_01035 [Patescibacteria group bacterium]|nr:hypothetical protein [Patescibacteria group bacterium]